MMRWAVFLALICTFSMQQVSLFSSNTDNTIITAPSGYYPILQAYHTQMHPNYIGYSAQWLYKNGAGSWPAGDTTTFQSYFYAACLSSATLVITADDTFSVTVNGGKAMTGDTQLKIYRFTVSNLKCGTNTIKVTVKNKDPGTPAAVIYAVVQDQTICFQCASPLAYYNRYKCKCQCNEKGKCPTTYPNYVWKNYPACGCACNKVLKCPAKQYFNLNTCGCECNPISCLPGYVQSLKTCNCIKKCPIITTCAKNQTWSETECKCNCTTVKKCDAPLYWNTVTCSCENAMKPAGSP